MPAPPDGGELDGVVAFIAAQQAHPDRRIAYLGTDPAGIAAEMAGFRPPWATTARVVRDGDVIAGAVVVEWDDDLGRAWIVGPWVDAAAEAWMAAAARLVAAALAQVPAEITRHEMCGDVANHRLADLAASMGWTATEVNHVLVADAGVVAAWPAGEDGGAEGLRAATAGDVDAIAALHDAEFPGTYASAATLVGGQLDGSRVVLVADRGGGSVAGYAAGEVHDDGEGYVDFVVVGPAARRTGLGRRLVTALTRELLGHSPLGRVGLVVQDHRAPARALYERLGFRPDGSLVAYRSWTS